VPSFQLSDRFGFSTDIQSDVQMGAAITRYFKNAPDWLVAAIDLKSLKDITWDDAGNTTVKGDLTFDSPAQLGSSVSIDAGVVGTLGLVSPPDVDVPLDVRYVGATLRAQASGSISAPLDNLTFGFKGGSSITFGYYQAFSLNPATPVVLDSIKETVAHFMVPGDIHDIAAMPEGSVATVEGTGEVKFSGSVNLLTLSNPLASVSLPVLGDLDVTATEAIQVGAAFHYFGDYQVRVQKLAPARFRLGVFRKQERDFTVTADAAAGISTSKDSLLQTVLSAISKQPQFAGIPAPAADALQATLKLAVNRTLSLGVSLEVQAGGEDEAMFQYEVDASQLHSPDAINNALRGDFTGLGPAPGITVLKSLVAETKTLAHRLKINLLGIYNAASVSSFIEKSSAAWDSDSGEYTLIDSTTAQHTSVASDLKALRSALAESVVVTAAYRTANLISGPPELQSHQTYFKLANSPSEVAQGIAIANGLGFASSQQIPALSGKTTILAETSYDNAAFTSLFFDANGQLRTQDDYDRAGRSALRFITMMSDRLRVASDDALWAKLRQTGNPQQFRQFFPAAPVLVLADIGTDYINIVWWAEAMLGAGKILQAMRRPDANFEELKASLAKHLADVTRRTGVDFGGPWGLLAMSRVAASADRRFVLSNVNFTWIPGLQKGVPA